MEGNLIKTNKWLVPLSWLYGLGVWLRNTLFETGVLKSRAFTIPVIAVGNITVGGTGKTPHVEYLVRLLRDRCKVAVLSRGYMRKTKGFVKATNETDATAIGDEPYQMKKKFPDVTIAVDAKRCRGIDILTDQDRQLDVILLDDAFQHRYVKPGINILLVDYHRIIIYDRLLPAGRLREPVNGKDRADIVIVTKCPKGLKPMEYRVITKTLKLYPYQNLYFTTFDYGELQPLFDGPADYRQLEELKEVHTLLLAGIASPRQLELDLEPLVPHLTSLTFGDHHTFRKKDIQAINDRFASLPSPKCIVTTEKDAARLAHVSGLSDEVRAHLYVLPVRVSFMQEQEEMFNHQIVDYVRKNSRNSIMVKDKDVRKPENSNNTGDRPRTISFRNNR